MFRRARRLLAARALRATGALTNTVAYTLNERRLARN